MNQICRYLLSNSITFMLSNLFSDNSIASLLNPIHDFRIFCIPIRHQQQEIFPWALPTPGLQNKGGKIWKYC